MADTRIEHLDRKQLKEAKKLVRRCFPVQSPGEWLSFWAIANRDSPQMRRMMSWVGVADILDFWGAIDRQTGTMLGTTGLYQYTSDAREAVWLAWLCVAPEARRQGIGSRLLDFSIEEARRSGLPYLRLYTSDMRNEAAAQILYESRGLKITSKKWRPFYQVIYRELRLDSLQRGELQSH
jgi:ribosomal protein S18 acetylase RimI-like enzyme